MSGSLRQSRQVSNKEQYQQGCSPARMSTMIQRREERRGPANAVTSETGLRLSPGLFGGWCFRSLGQCAPVLAIPVPVAPDRFHGASFERFLAQLQLFLGGGLLVHVGKPFVLVALKILRSGLAAQVAVDAFAIDVERP